MFLKDFVINEDRLMMLDRLFLQVIFLAYNIHELD